MMSILKFCKRSVVPLFLGVMILVGCRAGDSGNSAEQMTVPPVEAVSLVGAQKLLVVATTNIIGDVVTSVGGDTIDLVVLVDQGQDPHNYQPRAKDLVAIETAHLIFINGLGLEEVLLSTISSTATGFVVPVSAGINPIAFSDESDEHAGEEHPGDPHFWMNPNNVIVWTRNIQSMLSQADPANTSVYARNAEAYIASLQELDAYIRQQVALIPPQNRKLITDHEEFSYFADEYGLDIVGTVIPGVTTNIEPSAAELTALSELIREEQIPTVFIGMSTSARLQQLAQIIADESGVDVRILPLYTGSLAPSGEPGDTYLGMMRYNIDQLVAGLGS